MVRLEQQDEVMLDLLRRIDTQHVVILTKLGER